MLIYMGIVADVVSYLPLSLTIAAVAVRPIRTYLYGWVLRAHGNSKSDVAKWTMKDANESSERLTSQVLAAMSRKPVDPPALGSAEESVETSAEDESDEKSPG